MDYNRWNNNGQQNNQNYNMSNNSWNNTNGYNQQQQGGYNQQNYRQQNGYSAQPPLGQQIDLQAQYAQQQAYGTPIPQKKKGKGLIIAIVVLLVLVLGVIGSVKLLGGKDKEEPNQEIEVIEAPVEETEVKLEDTMKDVLENDVLNNTTPEKVEDTAVNPDEIVQNKVPTLAEMNELWESLGFYTHGTNEINLDEDELDAKYYVYDTDIAAVIAYEAFAETQVEESKAPHTDKEGHYTKEIIKEEDLGGHKLIQYKYIWHDKDCTPKEEYRICQYILYGKSVLWYGYDTNGANKTSSDLKAFEKAMELTEYPLAERPKAVEAEERATELEAFETKLNDYGIDANYNSTFDDGVKYSKYEKEGLEILYYVYGDKKAAETNLDTIKDSVLTKEFEYNTEEIKYTPEIVLDETDGRTRIIEIKYTREGVEEFTVRRYVSYLNSILVYTFKVDANGVQNDKVTVLEKILPDLGYNMSVTEQE